METLLDLSPDQRERLLELTWHIRDESGCPLKARVVEHGHPWLNRALRDAADVEALIQVLQDGHRVARNADCYLFSFIFRGFADALLELPRHLQVQFGPQPALLALFSRHPRQALRLICVNDPDLVTDFKRFAAELPDLTALESHLDDTVDLVLSLACHPVLKAETAFALLLRALTNGISFETAVQEARDWVADAQPSSR